MKDLLHVRSYDEPIDAVAVPVSGGGSAKAWCASGATIVTPSYPAAVTVDPFLELFSLYLNDRDPDKKLMYFLNAKVTNLSESAEPVDFKITLNYRDANFPDEYVDSGIVVSSSSSGANEYAAFSQRPIYEDWEPASVRTFMATGVIDSVELLNVYVYNDFFGWITNTGFGDATTVPNLSFDVSMQVIEVDAQTPVSAIPGPGLTRVECFQRLSTYGTDIAPFSSPFDFRIVGEGSKYVRVHIKYQVFPERPDPEVDGPWNIGTVGEDYFFAYTLYGDNGGDGYELTVEDIGTTDIDFEVLIDLTNMDYLDLSSYMYFSPTEYDPPGGTIKAFIKTDVTWRDPE